MKNHRWAFHGTEEAIPVIVSPHKQNLKSGTDQYFAGFTCEEKCACTASIPLYTVVPILTIKLFKKENAINLIFVKCLFEHVDSRLLGNWVMYVK